jgi:hypothetical protein
LTDPVTKVDNSLSFYHLTDMQANFDKARKLISELESKLIDTSTHTVAARKALDAWIQSGEAGLGKKGSSALKQVRKRADSFTKSLTKLEHNLATSLDKLSDSLKKKAAKKASGKTAKKAASKKSDKPAKKVTSKPAAPAVKKAAVSGTSSKKKAPAKKAKS